MLCSYIRNVYSTGIPVDNISIEGAVLILTVWNHESLLPDDVLGEVIVQIADIPNMNTRQTIEDMQTVLLPLKQYPEPTHGPYHVSHHFKVKLKIKLTNAFKV